MALTKLSFAEQIAVFCRKTQDAALSVAQESAVETAFEMQKIGPSVASQKRADAKRYRRERPSAGPAYDPGQGGNMPVDTGFLRASLRASTSAPVAMNTKGDPNKKYRYDRRRVDNAIRKAKLGDTIFLSYGAEYAGYQEYGANGRPGRAFVRLTAQRWHEIVARVVARHKARSNNE